MSGTPVQKVSGFKKPALAFATLLVVILSAMATYLLAEAYYRYRHGIPVLVLSPAVDTDPRTLSPEDTSVMDFNLGYYYEIFRRSANPILFYEPRPGFSKGAVQINSHGFRDREFPLDPPPGTTRIVVLGDSVIWGHRIALEDTFAKQLEVLLAERAEGRFEVLNFGVSGYSLQQEIEVFIARAKDFHPGIVIVGTSVNDLEYSSVEGDFFQQQSAGMLERSYLLEAAKTGTSYLLTRYIDVPPRYLEQIVDVEANLKRGKEAAPDIHWMMLMFPLLENLNNYALVWDHDELLEPARRLGFVVHDLLPDFRPFPGPSLGVDHIHPNRFGNGIAAQAALDTLVGAGWVRLVDQ